MTRQTSIEVYKQIENEGLLSKRRLQVFKAVIDNAPCTSAEALATMITKNSAITSSRARFTELRDRGVIKELPPRKCKITGRVAIEWDVTCMLPVEPEKKEKRPRGFKKCIEYMIDVMEKTNHKTFSLINLKKIHETL